MQQTLARYLPEKAIVPCCELLKTHQVHLKIVRQRITLHGDYKLLPGEKHQISINANLNPYRFLMTLIHEIAHLVVYKERGKRTKPHGLEWKETFTRLMLPFIEPAVFPAPVLPLVARHFKNPRASSDADAALSIALKQFDPPSDKNYVFELPLGILFKIYDGRVFKRGNKRVKRYECKELKTGKLYLFSPHAEVEIVSSNQFT